MLNKILFIFEGINTEIQIIKNLQKFFVNENTSVKCVFGGEIYQIYKEIIADEDLDTFNLIKERSESNKKILADYNRSDFAEIYMFFDYDGHSTLAEDYKLKELLSFFKEETDRGKLYISYPMVESLKHICDINDFKNLVVDCYENISYKSLVHRTSIDSFKSFNKYELETWNLLINLHLRKMNYIVRGSYSFPSEIFEQFLIYEMQLQKFIIPKSKVAVLNSFPVFLLDYYGNLQILDKVK